MQEIIITGTKGKQGQIFTHVGPVITRNQACDQSENRWPWMTLNGIMAVILRYFTELVCDVVVKQLPRFQNVLLIVHNHAY